jgi:ATP-dependent Clp protease protease subunit
VSDIPREPEEEICDAPDDTPQNVFIIDTGSKGPKFRAVSLFGVLNEEELADVVQAFVALKEAFDEEKAREGDGAPEPQPIRFYISTWGGDVHGMFAIYDLMRSLSQECEIETIGLGKVMSAGVLLLAAGTKGKRTIGKNARIMLHGIRAGHHGSLASLESEMEESRWIQEHMIEALASETKLTKRKIQKMIDEKVDVYIGAEDAVALGIADIII